MLAWHLTESPGQYDWGEVPTPETGPGEVRVSVRASSLNHMDLWLTTGLPKPPSFPHVPGNDVAGVVESVGEGVTDWAPGDEVVVNMALVPEAALANGVDSVLDPALRILGEHCWGGHGEFCVVPAHSLERKPPGRTWAEAAAYPVCATTAWRLLRRARLQPEDTVLVTGIGGGVATAAMILAQQMGARVFTTSRDERKRKRSIELGAEDSFDSEGPYPVTADIVVDSIGPATWEHSIRTLRHGGRMCVCGGTSGQKVELALPRLFFKQLDIIGGTCGSQEEFRHVTDLVGAGMPVIVDEVLPLAQYPVALDRLRSAAQLGKIVLEHPGGHVSRTDTAALRERAWAEVDRRADDLLEISHRIFDEPELCFQEHRAHDLLCDSLEAEGLRPTRSAFGLDTAFVADAGSVGPTVGVLCEYDALPGIGHACGHNVIAAAGLGAGLAAAALAEEAGGRVRILGSPAEEGGGGKVFMLRAGAFQGLDAAVMVHPADHDLPELTTLAIQRLKVEYHGRASHAAAAPHLGRNALDAAVLGYVNVAALRQHIRPEERVHGVFTDGGGQANIVPSRAAMEWYVRSPTEHGLEALRDRVLECLRGGATAAGCTMEHEWVDPPYSEMLTDPDLLASYSRHAAALGRPIGDPEELGHVVGSTDMGNVSKVVPSIHPLIAVAPPGVSIHTPEFAAHARGEAGDRAVLDGAKALVATVLDRWATGV